MQLFEPDGMDPDGKSDRLSASSTDVEGSWLPLRMLMMCSEMGLAEGSREEERACDPGSAPECIEATSEAERLERNKTRMVSSRVYL